MIYTQGTITVPSDCLDHDSYRRGYRAALAKRCGCIGKPPECELRGMSCQQMRDEIHRLRSVIAQQMSAPTDGDRRP